MNRTSAGRRLPGMLLCLLVLLLAVPVAADGPGGTPAPMGGPLGAPNPPSPQATPTPEPTPTPQPGPGWWNPIKIIFPFESLKEALRRVIAGFIEDALGELDKAIAESFGRWVTMTPGILTPGGGAAELPVDMMGVWQTTVAISAILWPVTLAIIGAIAAKDVVAARSWGIGDLKEAIFGWLISAAAAGTSIYWMDMANRITNGVTHALLGMQVDWSALSFGLLVGAVGAMLGAGGFGLMVAIIVFCIGLATLFALIFQFIARYVLLYVLVAIAPIVITIAILPPARWLRWMWIKGFVLMELVGPINALLIKLVLTMVNISSDTGFVPALVQFLGAVGILSLLLTVNYTIIRFVFGAIQETAHKVVSTLTSLTVMAAGALGAVGLATGAIGSGAVSGGWWGGSGCSRRGNGRSSRQSGCSRGSDRRGWQESSFGSPERGSTAPSLDRGSTGGGKWPGGEAGRERHAISAEGRSARAGQTAPGPGAYLPGKERSLFRKFPPSPPGRAGHGRRRSHERHRARAGRRRCDERSHSRGCPPGRLFPRGGQGAGRSAADAPGGAGPLRQALRPDRATNRRTGGPVHGRSQSGKQDP